MGRARVDSVLAMRAGRVSLPRCLACAAALGLLPGPGSAQESCPQGRVSEIVFERDKPFGAEATSEEARMGWLFRALNAVHIRTLPVVLRWELYVEEGDCLPDPFLLQESERSLRSLPYIVEAQVRSEPLPDGTHRIRVHTVDAWAISFGLAFTVDQGFTLTGVSANAKNLLGTGTQVGVFRNVYRERKRVGLLGRQPNLFGTRIDATVHGGSTRSDDYIAQSLYRPFAGEVGTNAFRQSVLVVDDYFLYSVDPSLGFTQAFLRYESEAYELTYQRLFGSREGTRFLAGLGVSREEIRFPFGDDGVRIVTDGDFEDPTAAPPGVIGAVAGQANDYEATRVSLMLGVRDQRFLNRGGLDALRASQDVPSGVDVTLTVAPSVGGGEVDDILLRSRARYGQPVSWGYLQLVGDAQVRNVTSAPDDDPTGWRDAIYELTGDGYWTQQEGAQLYGRVQLAGGNRMDRPFQLTLGGREGVRAYNEDAYPGGRRLLLTVEQRFGLPRLSTSFADVGVVAFADAGRMWDESVPFGESHGWKAGIGAGVRLGFPAGSPGVFRLDVGLPLTGDGDTRGTVFRAYAELLGILDRRSWPTQVERSRWHGVDPDLTARPMNPLAGN